MTEAFILRDEEGDLVLSVGLPDWAPQGACVSSGHPGEFLEDFFVEETSDGQPTEQVLAAKRICAGCPVRPECLDWALSQERGEEFRSGIFGGLSPNERAIINQAKDPISLGLEVLDRQVRMGLVLTRIPRFEEEARVRSSGTE